MDSKTTLMITFGVSFLILVFIAAIAEVILLAFGITMPKNPVAFSALGLAFVYSLYMFSKAKEME